MFSIPSDKLFFLSQHGVLLFLYFTLSVHLNEMCVKEQPSIILQYIPINYGHQYSNGDEGIAVTGASTSASFTGFYFYVVTLKIKNCHSRGQEVLGNGKEDQAYQTILPSLVHD